MANFPFIVQPPIEAPAAVEVTARRFSLGFEKRDAGGSSALMLSVILHAATSAVDTDWTARLCRVDPSGVSINLQEGIVRARYRASLTSPALLEPNRVYEYEVRLGPVGARIPAGHRLRVAVSSSDFPQWDRNLNTGGRLGTEGPSQGLVATQVVFHDASHPSRVLLPVLGEA